MEALWSKFSDHGVVVLILGVVLFNFFWLVKELLRIVRQNSNALTTMAETLKGRPCLADRDCHKAINGATKPER